jgi:hemolysin activation/secretion protein
MTILKRNLTVLILVAASPSAFAQHLVGAGGQIQQIPPTAAQERSIPVLPLSLPLVTPIPVPDGTKFVVKSLRITGQARFSEAELVAIAHFQPGRELTLSDLRAMTSLITSHYNQHGYFLARAYLPPQDITDGTVRIAVLEGKYGQISLRNQSHTSDITIIQILSGLHSGDTVQSAPLERRLLIISDLPGTVANATLSPGSAVGASDLTVGVTPGARVDGDIEADNWGNPYTGAYRVGGTINVNEPLGWGDVLSLRTMESTDGGMDYGRISYQGQIQDATLGMALTGFKYDLGKQYTRLDANGTELIGSLYASYPLIRSYNDNLYLLLDADQRFFRDNIGATFTTTRKEATVLMAGVSGNWHDNFGGGGWNNYSLMGSVGNLDIISPWARAEDAMTARTNGGYAKLAGSASRLQTLIGPLSLYIAARGQIASKNLDISEQMELGGATGVRAYPEGEAYGDEGYIATIEPRLLLPTAKILPGQLQLIAFADTGYVTINQTPFTNAQNGLRRSGAGVGLIWSAPNNFMVTVTYANSIGGTKATSYPDNSGELWLQAIKFF